MKQIVIIGAGSWGTALAALVGDGRAAHFSVGQQCRTHQPGAKFAREHRVFAGDAIAGQH